MERVFCHVLTKNMVRRSMKTWTTVALATSSIVMYDKIKNYFTTSTLFAQSKKEGNWFNNFLSQKDTDQTKSLSSENINTILRRQEYTKKIDRYNTEPAVWFETNHYNANNPIEDRHCECKLNLNGSYFFGIFDGHSGWHCSETLRTRLPLYMSLAFLPEAERQSFISKELSARELVEFLGNPDDDCLSFKYPENFHGKQERMKTGSSVFASKILETTKYFSISDLLKFTYLSLDADITREAIPDGVCNEPIWNGLSGAVAIGAYIKDNDVYVASTGDCRGVIGARSSSGSWFDLPMSEDHCVENIREVGRIRSEHPGEGNSVIFNGRLLGQLQPLRSFGDVVYKWTKELHSEVLETLYGRPLVAKHIYLTPPYLTAQPDVNHKKLDKDDRFLILATDGLWDTLSNEMAVKIVGEYLDDLKSGVEHEENAATKLIRYALGNKDEKLLGDMLQLPEHIRRNYHDDITVTIIYFDPEYQYFKSKL